jgi:hypothetical protein
MMKEFHAEDRQQQSMTGLSLPALINATAEHPKPSPPAILETVSPATRIDSSPSLPQQPITADLNKSSGLKVECSSRSKFFVDILTTMLQTSRRASSEVRDTATSVHARIRPNDLVNERVSCLENAMPIGCFRVRMSPIYVKVVRRIIHRPLSTSQNYK